MSDLLLSLWDEGWEPMTPIDMAAKEKYVLLSYFSNYKPRVCEEKRQFSQAQGCVI
jgi:hypothetical protein